MTTTPTPPGAPPAEAPTPLPPLRTQPAGTARRALRSPARPCDGRLPGSTPLPDAGRMADVRSRVPVAGSSPRAPRVPLRGLGVGVGCPAPRSAVPPSDWWLGGLAPLRVGSRMADVRALSGRVRVGDRIPGAPLTSLRGLGVGVGCRALGSAVQGFTGVPGRLWGRAAISCVPLVLRGPAAGAAGWALGSAVARFGGLVTSGEERAV